MFSSSSSSSSSFVFFSQSLHRLTITHPGVIDTSSDRRKCQALTCSVSQECAVCLLTPRRLPVHRRRSMTSCCLSNSLFQKKPALFGSVCKFLLLEKTIVRRREQMTGDRPLPAGPPSQTHTGARAHASLPRREEAEGGREGKAFALRLIPREVYLLSPNVNTHC